MKWLAQFFLQALAFLLAKIPHAFYIQAGKILGFFLYSTRFRTHLAEENIQRAFPNMEVENRAILLKENYQHYGFLLLEFLRSFWNFAAFLEEKTRIEGEEHIRNSLKLGKGVLVMTAHVGNWEVLPAHGSYILKVPVTMVTKRLKPSWFHEIVEATRSKLGTHMAYEPRTMQKIIRALRNGEIVGFAMDQFAGAPVGARVPFFNIPVGTNTVLAVLAQRTGAPVVPGLAIRATDGSFLIKFLPPIPLTESSTLPETIIKNTALYSLCIEQWVREFPNQWLWIHKRWKGDLSPLPENCIGEMMKPD